MPRVIMNILGINELKWNRIGKFNSNDHYSYHCRQESPWRNELALIFNKRVWNAVFGCHLKMTEWWQCFWGKPFNITVIQVYAPTTNTEEADIEWFCEDLQDLLELTPKKDILFIAGYWNANVGSQEIPGVTGKFGLGVQNEAGECLTEVSEENTLVIANTLFQQHKKWLLYIDITRWSILKSDWLYSLYSKMKKLYTVSKKKTRSWL